jgi:hypothetical protein
VELEQSLVEARTWHVKYVNDPKIARDAANSDSTSLEDLILLASSLDPNSIPRYLRHRIAEVATREDILIKLSQDPAARVRDRPTKRLEILRKDRAERLKTQ